MQSLQKYFVAANDSNLLELSSQNRELQFFGALAPKQLPISFSNTGISDSYVFHTLIALQLNNERQRLANDEITKQTFEMLKCRLNGHVLAFFGTEEVKSISYKKVASFITYLMEEQVGAVTINQYLGLLKRVLFLGVLEGAIEQVPIFPKLKSKSIPRGSFSVKEYSHILKLAKRLSSISEAPKAPTHRNTANGAFIKTAAVPAEMNWLIGFMVNTFIRPVDIKLIKNKNIEAIDGANKYLRISMVETKKHSGQIVSMRVAVNIYRKILEYQTARGWGKPDDYVFFPEVKDRQGAIALISSHFKKILDTGNMSRGANNEKRSLYSLRHTAITFRLLFGRGIDLLTLARNARTSVEMIERFYSSNLTAEMNIELLQSKRTGNLEHRVYG
jgi:integrase